MTQFASPIIVVEQQKKALIGSWIVTINAPGLEPSRALFIFNEGGTLVGSTHTDFNLEQQLACTAGHGVWQHQGGRTFSYT